MRLPSVRVYPYPAEPPTPEALPVRSRRRDEIPNRFKWNLDDIFPDWDTCKPDTRRSRA